MERTSAAPDFAGLREDLRRERQALLAVLDRLAERHLDAATRNAGWAVRDVLAHVIASDADLVWLLEAGESCTGGVVRHPGEAHHQEAMALWARAGSDVAVGALRDHTARWSALLEAATDRTLAIDVDIWWRPAPAPVLAVLADWRGHDAQHAEDVHLAIASHE